MNSVCYLRLLRTALKQADIYKNVSSFNWRCTFNLRPQLFLQPCSSLSGTAGSQTIVSGTLVDTLEQDENITKEILSRVNSQISEKTHSRLFAVVQVGNKKYKITAEDIIAYSGNFAGRIGDRICLEKVLIVGSREFTLLGRPLLSKDLIRIEATVIEKTYIVPRPWFRFVPRKSYRKLLWFRTPSTLLRINTIDFQTRVDEIPTVEGIQDRVIY